jgi:hypothetical protein
MKALDPQRKQWDVGRRVLPWRRKARMPDLDWLDFGGGGDDLFGWIVVIVAVPVLIFVAIVLSELLLLLLLVPIIVGFRILFRRPWAVVTRQGRIVMGTEYVQGWAEAGERVQQIANEIQSGQRRTG